MKLYGLLKLIGDESRLKILFIIYFCELNNIECNVTKICKYTMLGQPNVSKHLRKLYEFGIVTKSNEHKQVFYNIDQNYVEECYIFEPLMQAFNMSEDGIYIKKQILGD